MKQQIFIRVDGSQEMGLGHLVRCISLSYMLRDNFKISFVCKEIPDAIRTEILDNNFQLLNISDENSFFEILSEKNIVVLDGYKFDTEYQMQIKTKGCKLVCIDDLHDKEFVADLIINHAPGIFTTDYKAQSNTQFALGTDYLLLRPAFLNQRKKTRSIQNIETILICFGGADPTNLTLTTLQVVIKCKKFSKIIVITGGAYQMTSDFCQLLQSDSRVEHRYRLNEKQMLDAMIECQFAIVPISGVLFEIFSVGVPVATGYYIDNQYEAAKSIENSGLVYYCGNMLKDYPQKLLNVMQSISLRDCKHMVRLQKNMFNYPGKSILDLFKSL